ncbi:MAG: cytochrome b/b6 domain-containing protein [Hydrogenophaga sp.]|nr:cytochrome b/b6 domain-containing protein [Hydrogenophaga sp.]
MQPPRTAMHTIRIWDLPTRVFHWLLTICVIGLVITGSVGGNWMNWHLRLGYAVLTLLLFRLVWGFVGGHWSRFGSFLYAPTSVVAYLRGRALPEHEAGHTPLGALSVLALLLILAAQVGTGLISDDEIAVSGPLARFVSGDTVSLASGYHTEVGKFIVMALVVLHVLAILFYKVVKKQSLVRPMVVGDKQLATPVRPARDSAGKRMMALAILIVCGALVAWLVKLGNTF